MQIGTALNLKYESNNKLDPCAVGVYTLTGTHIGYVPRFYSKVISSLLTDGIEPNAVITYVNEKSTPHWWVKLKYESEISGTQRWIYDNLKTASEISQHV